MEKNSAEERRKKKIERLCTQRILSVLSDPDSSNADAFKAITLYCEHLRDDASGGTVGDMEIHLKSD